MIKKLVAVKNVGRLVNCACAGNVEFRPLTLLYGGNGRGKSTICDVLRSLQRNDPKPVKSRRTIGATEPSEIKVLTASGLHTFSTNAWNTPYANIVIFDSAFVHENVYEGDSIGVGQRRNLYRVAVGEQGVALARQVDALDEKIRVQTRAVSDRREVVQILVKDRTVEQFVALAEDAGIDSRISEKEREVAALSNAHAIKTQALLSRVSIQTIPPTFSEILARSLDDILEDADTLVGEHLQNHLGGKRNEPWLAKGTTLLNSANCPFCGQDIAGVELVAAYKSYFNEGYTALKNQVAEIQSTLNTLNSANIKREIALVMAENAQNLTAWNKFVEVVTGPLDVEYVAEKIGAVGDGYRVQYEAKANAPLDPISSDFMKPLQKGYDGALLAVQQFNETVDQVNEKLKHLKATVDAADLPRAQAELVRLKQVKLRHEPASKTACQNWEESVATKRAMDKQKDDAKAQLDTYTADVFTRYQAAINKLLGNFGAEFRIHETKGNYVGGKPQTTYQIKINGQAVALSDETGSGDSPSFKTTLSGGDRSALALAFFLAQLEHDGQIATKVIVFDDPFTSQDRFRRDHTATTVCQLVQKAAQVILLSHDPAFLKLAYDRSDKAKTKTLQLMRVGLGSSVREWDIETDTMDDYFKSHLSLQCYRVSGTGDKVAIARTIRPFLEAWVRYSAPNRFGATEWLGDMIGAIRNAPAGDPLEEWQCILTDLEEINNYSKAFHHSATHQSVTPEQIDDGELTTYVDRTLKVVGSV